MREVHFAIKMDVNHICAYDVRNELKKRGLDTNGSSAEIRTRLQADLVVNPPPHYQSSRRVSRSSAHVTVSQASAEVTHSGVAQATATTRRITATRTTAVLVTSSDITTTSISTTATTTTTTASLVASSRSAAVVAAVQSSLPPTLPVSTPLALVAIPSPPAPLATMPNPSTTLIPSLPTPPPSTVISPPPHISSAMPSVLTVYRILRELMIILGFGMIISIFCNSRGY